MSGKQQAAPAAKPLAGIRVLDLSWVLAGPVTGRLLADAGAQVIKVESRKRLDNTRRGRALPSAPGEPVSDPIDRVPMFHNLNAGKKSFACDLSQPEGTEVLKQLVAASDVVLDNFAPGVMRRLGLDWPVLRAINPRIVMISMSGTGQQGPLSDIPAYAPTVTSLAGLESVVGYPGEMEPVGILGLNLADSFAGMFAFQAVLTALWARQETGEGQFIDFSELEGICTMMAWPFMDYACNGRVMAPSGNAEAGASPSGVFPAAGVDAWVAISIQGEQQWGAFCRATPGASWSEEAQWADAAFRLNHRDALNRMVAQWTREQPPAALVHGLRMYGVNAAPVHDIAGQVADPHFWERGLFRKVTVEGLGDLTLYGSPWRLAATPTLGCTGAPRLGEHTCDVLKDVLDYDEARIRELAANNILV